MKKCLMMSCIIIVSCAQPQKEPYELPENAKHLIAGDSAKTWKLARRFNNKTRMNMEQDYKFFKILHVSEEELTLQFNHMQFSNKTTSIINIYVPEYVSVKDREFHW